MPVSQLISNEQCGCEYRNSEASCAHEYVLPSLFRELRAISQGKSLKILDLGCGNGYVAAQIAARGHIVSGVDVSSGGIAMARASFPGVSYHAGSVYDDDLPEKVHAPVDCVISLEVIEHLFFPIRLFKQSYRLLVDGGTLMISTPYHGYLKNLALSVTNGWDRHFGVDWDGGHIKFFSKNTLSRMASRAGFENIRLLPVGRVPGLWKSMIIVAQKGKNSQ
jgi:2-polyprenyl-3-methyl-5-hydroxy-6-metoxy-1,4-benzoquinol methylase